MYNIRNIIQTVIVVPMDIFKKLKEYARQINEIEYSISSNKKEFLEIYERNLALEQEILERTQELDQANKAFLTLKHVWDLMNSSEPLANVLETLVNSLHGEMGYINSTILQLHEIDNLKYFQIRAYSDSQIYRLLNKFLHRPLSEYKLPYDISSPLVRAITEKKIICTKDYLGVINSLLNDLAPDQLAGINRLGISKNLIIIPLITSQKVFGVMLVFSPREDISDKEVNFLSLFANQVEMAITIANLFETIRKEAVTDGLTGLYNRRYFNDAINKEMERAQRLKQSFSVISLDLDFLKKINDMYGHSFGDLAISTVADIMKKNARSIDIPARLGGEEFCILLPGIDSAGAVVAAERIRASIEAKPVETVGHITASIGVGTYPQHAKNLEELLELTDQAMYKSKINGRNRVTVVSTEDDHGWQEIAIGAFADIVNKKRIPVPDNLIGDINEKIKATKESMSKDALYSVVDMISALYNPNAAAGLTRQKIDLATKLAQKLALSKDDIDKLKLSVLLYDIGNALIPEDIMTKTTPLSDEDKSKIHQHPLLAAKEILQPISSVTDIIPIVENHHENWDGSGYPKKISGEEIPLLSQIILLVDAYCAMTHERTYRAALSEDDAIENITKESGKKWKKELVDVFVGMINETKRNN